MTETDEKWGLTSGLPLSDVDATITGFEFGFNAQVGAGLVCANIEFTIDENGDTADQSFTVGDGWDIADKGGSITGRKQLNNQSNWGRLVGSMVAACGGAEGINEALPDVDYRVAGGWIGSKWHLGTADVEVRDMKIKDKTVMKVVQKIVATAFNGVDTGAASTAKPAAGTKAGATKAAGNKAGAKKGLADSNPDLFAELVALAGEYDDHDGFMAAALEREDVESDAIAMNAVMSTKAGSVWASKG